MKVPFRLTRRENPPAAADAFLLLADSAGPLANACTHLDSVTLPQIHTVRGGFLLVPPETTTHHLPGAVRLVRLAADVFIPIDAELSPALLPDEAVALTRERGLVVLAGGEVLAFDPVDPLPIDRWLAPVRVRREAWEPFPPRPDAMERLTVIERPAPPTAVEVLIAGRPDGSQPLAGAGEGSPDGTAPVPEDARPPSGPPLLRIAAGIGMGFGQFLAWLGRMLRVPGLARAGANLARKALDRVPRLSERLLGAQEAALREVLRQLQSGDVERGLRRAPIAVPDPDRPAQVGTNANLGTRDPRYSLRDLIGSGGAATGWLGGGDVWGELAREYRRLAQEAAARGDVRRAAYLYGVLLRDLRSAANALMTGGLFRDAAILFRDKLKDESSAASAFERAGDYDEALRLYDRLGRYEQAGDLLRRLGDEERAVEYFTRAADRLATQGRWLAAGDLIRTKARRAEGATWYYRYGWEDNGAEAVACAERLLDEYLVSQRWPEVARLLDEAEVVLASPRSRDAGRFFNYALKVGTGFLPAEMNDDLADRVRLLFASHLRAHGRSRSQTRELAGELFGRAGTWGGSVVRDAAFAVRDVERKPAAAPTHEPPVHLADGTVTAVAVARESFDIVVATTTAVVCWRMDDGRVVPVVPRMVPAALSMGEWKTVGLSIHAAGGIVYTLRTDGRDVILRCFLSSQTGGFTSMGQTRFPDEAGGRWYLQESVVVGGAEQWVALASPTGRKGFSGLYLREGLPGSFLTDGSNTHLLVWDEEHWTWDWDDRFLRCLVASEGVATWARWVPHWSPAVPAGNTLLTPRVDWLTPAAGVLEVTGTDQDGVVHWSEFDARDPDERPSRTASVSHPDRFRAACLIAPGQVAAVTGQNEVLWLRTSGSALKRWASATKLLVPAAAVALVSRPPANEVVVLLENGSAIRIPRP